MYYSQCPEDGNNTYPSVHDSTNVAIPFNRILFSHEKE
jgi:hypothetical protein